MLASQSPQQAVAIALAGFNHDVRVVGESAGQFTSDDLIAGILAITGKAYVTMRLEQDTVCVGNRVWQVVCKISPSNEDGPSRFFNFSVANMPLRYRLAMGDEGWRETVEQAA